MLRPITYASMFFLLFRTCPSAHGQDTPIPFNTDYYQLVDRYEIRRGKWTGALHSSQKPYVRSQVIRLADSLHREAGSFLSPTDRFNLAYLLQGDESAGEASGPAGPTVWSSKAGRTAQPFFYPWLRGSPVDVFSLRSKFLDWRINPVLGLSLGKETGSSPALLAQSAGLETRGMIGNRVGFSIFFTTNRALYPRYIREYGQLYSVPGGGFAPGEGMAEGTDSLEASFLSFRGSLTTRLLRVMTFQVGHDRLFLGNGYRSMLLSDNSAPYWFAKLTTALGPLQYANLVTRLQNRQVEQGSWPANPAKYMVMHHLSANLGKRVNLGLFEATVFSRDQGIDLNYLNPIILYRYVESSLGSQDNAFVGLDIKTLIGLHGQFYGQAVLDEFRVKDLLAGQGAWTNKFAVQVGGKYLDALGVANLDFQGEINLARPFTYSHQSGQTNYIHFNQPLAHPLGSNFVETLSTVRYQRLRFLAEGTLGWMLVGRDLPGLNYGGNILKDYMTRFRSEGNFIGQGRKTIVTYANLRLTYMVRHNLFVDARCLYRLEDSQLKVAGYSTALGSVGMRWNLPYRNEVF